MADVLIFAPWQLWEKTPFIVVWIKGLTVKHEHTHTTGAVVLNYENLHDGTGAENVFSLHGAVSQVVINWFALSDTALSIAAGYETLGVDEADQKTNLIFIEKWRFWTRPALNSGVSALRFSYTHEPHSLWFQIVTEDSEVHSDDYHWAFNWRIDCCHKECFPKIMFAWVAVEKKNDIQGYEPHNKPEAMDT